MLDPARWAVKAQVGARLTPAVYTAAGVEALAKAQKFFGKFGSVTTTYVTVTKSDFRFFIRTR